MITVNHLERGDEPCHQLRVELSHDLRRLCHELTAPLAARGSTASGDRGSGTVWVLCLMLLVATFAFSLIAASGAAGRKTQAVAAADLAALSAADVLQHFGSSTQACAAAERVASLNAATLESCTVGGDVVDVTVVAKWATVGASRARGAARAGPIGAMPGH